MLTLTHRLPADPDQPVSLILPLTAEERTRSRYRLRLETEEVFLHLPRGTVLQDGDLLRDAEGNLLVRVMARPEPVLTVTAATPLELLRAAYHLGNRHVTLEINAAYLRLAPDPILKVMLEQLSLQVRAEVAPFQPEVGAYHRYHGH